MRFITRCLTSSEVAALSMALWNTTLNACRRKVNIHHVEGTLSMCKDKKSTMCTDIFILYVFSSSPYYTSPDLERELVEWVNLVEVVQDEVEQGGTGSSWTVTLSSFINFLLCYLRLCYLQW